MPSWRQIESSVDVNGQHLEISAQDRLHFFSQAKVDPEAGYDQQGFGEIEEPLWVS